VQFKTGSKAVRLEQLTDEIRALPGLAGIHGLSACGPSPAGDTEISVHVEDAALSAKDRQAISEAIARHVPDPLWGVSTEEKELAAILARSEGSLSLADLERAFRVLARPLDPTRAPPAIDGSDRE
jgi:hypothetical protein